MHVDEVYPTLGTLYLVCLCVILVLEQLLIKDDLGYTPPLRQRYHYAPSFRIIISTDSGIMSAQYLGIQIYLSTYNCREELSFHGYIRDTPRTAGNS